MEKPEEGYYRVYIRKAIGDGIRPEAKNLEGKVFYFHVGYGIPDDDARYPGEWEMTSDDPLYAQITGGKILWIASGDLKPSLEVEFLRQRNADIVHCKEEHAGV